MQSLRVSTHHSSISLAVLTVFRYDVAQLYLEQHDYDLDGAVEAYQDDEKWEKEHPLQDGKGKMSARTVGKRRFVGSA